MRKVSIIGLGYVGLPLAVAFGEIQNTIGFDISASRVSELKNGIDSTGEIPEGELIKSDITFTTNPDHLSAADFHIVTVPTPIDSNQKPDLSLVEKASEMVGKILKSGDMVVYESTVYPGVTEDTCIPILEKFSGLKAGRDFKVGYSPERVSPGSAYSLKKIHKLVAGQDEIALDLAVSIYKEILGDFVVPVSSIKVAEASKVLENVQRDVNIALINQVSILFKEMGVDTHEVLDAANTKWNFTKYSPGLVGGHCIGIDPYYLIDSGNRLGLQLSILKEARKANEYMVEHIIKHCAYLLSDQGKKIEDSIITILGLTFKENCPDTRNSKSYTIVEKLRELGARVQTYDPVLNWGSNPKDEEGNYSKSDAIILTVAHDAFLDTPSIIENLLCKDTIFMDIKGIFSSENFEEGIVYWRM